MWTKVLGFILVVLSKADVQLHWRGGVQDELRVVVKWNDRILFDRSFDILKE